MFMAASTSLEAGYLKIAIEDMRENFDVIHKSNNHTTHLVYISIIIAIIAVIISVVK